MKVVPRCCFVLALASSIALPLPAKPEPPCRPLLSCAASGGAAVCEVEIAEPRLCNRRTEIEIRWFVTTIGEDDSIERRPLSCDVTPVDRGGMVTMGLDRPLDAGTNYFVEAATIDPRSGALLGVSSLHLIREEGGHIPARNHPAIERPSRNSQEVTWRSER